MAGVFIANLEHISDLVLVFLLLTLNMLMSTGFWVVKNACRNFNKNCPAYTSAACYDSVGQNYNVWD